MRRALVVIAASGMAILGAAPALAGTVTAPAGAISTVPGDAAGNPKSITVTATGFAPGNGAAFVMQCDGVDPSTVGWSATRDCDTATSPAAADVGPDGAVTFPAGDKNYGFTPFKGKSPQGLFNCVAPGESMNNARPTFSNCRIRVASSLTSVTADQSFVTIVLPRTVPGGVASTQRRPAAAKQSSTSTRAKGSGAVARVHAGQNVSGAGEKRSAADERKSSASTSTVGDVLTSPASWMLLVVVFGLAFAAGRRLRERRKLARSDTWQGNASAGPRRDDVETTTR
jgi:hypothetical protein